MSNQNYEGGFKRDSRDDGAKIFVGGISRESTEEDLKNYFSAYGTVKQCILKMDPATSKSRCFGFVTFEDPSTVDRVLEEKTHYLNNKAIDPKRATERLKDNEVKNNNEGKKIFVGGIDPNLPESDLRDYFEQFGTIEKVDMPFDKETNKKRGFCFVTFSNSNAVETVCMSAKHTIGGKSADVRKAEEKRPQNQSRGGGRGGSSTRGYAYNGSGGGDWNAQGTYPPQQYPVAGAYYGQQPQQGQQMTYGSYGQQGQQMTYPSYSQQGQQMAYPGYGQQDPYAGYYGQMAYQYGSVYGGQYSSESSGQQQQQQHMAAADEAQPNAGPIRHDSAKNRPSPY